ncbi:uncharacterized protein LOC124446354 [Xenia sp. Carnegie-2017]|uniref:uncharacterized protein LOC124446354 n=1 Tax=Xenia sp. Carnegie-2017 TaxID=2897299 RepID=UPI001F040857|nr:uncharacterized protein LOC124446354 [Xenia sp. Carnegie-2017]
MFCQNCGTKLLDKAKFCHNCGFCALSDFEIGSKPSSKTIGVKPLSFEEFLFKEMCAERWIDPIGKLSDNDQNNLEKTLIAEEETGQPTVATMQEVVHLIQDNVNRMSTNRFTIPRQLDFADYVDARKQKWFAEGGNLKICSLVNLLLMVVAEGGSFSQMSYNTLS